MEKVFIDSFKTKIKMIQYLAALVITEKIKGTSSDLLYQELILESLAGRRWSHK